MYRVLILLFLIMPWFSGLAQRERVHLDLNRYTCKAGDTVFLSGTILRGGRLTAVSKNLYIELYTENGTLLQRFVFPIVHGQSVGQIIIPDSLPTANYFIRALTRQQLNFNSTDFFSVPVLVYNREKPAAVHHKRQVIFPPSVASGTIKGIGWLYTLYKGKLYSLHETE